VQLWAKPTQFHRPTKKTTMTRKTTKTQMTSQSTIIMDHRSPPTVNDFRLQLHQQQGRHHMSIITYCPNRRWTSGSTHGYRRDDIMVQHYHLHRHHIRDTNWRIQSIDGIWIIRVFIFEAGTHSTELSQYISIPAQLLLSSGIHYQSLWSGLRITN
jgi:hypothetical protein